MKRRRKGARSQSRKRRRPLRLESLELRRVLAAFLVTTSDDVVDAGDGLTSLREAISSANNSVGPDTIGFDPAAFASPTQIDLVLGQLDINDSLTITGPGQHLLTINGQDASRVIGFFASASDLTLEDLTITGGRTSDDDVNTNNSGGGIRFASAGTLTLNRATVFDNSTGGAGARGGGIFAEPGNVVLLDSLVTQNHTEGTDAKGGGVYLGSGSISLTNSEVSGNTTAQERARGGGIYSSGTTVSIIQSRVTDNQTAEISSDGGGIFADAELTVDASVISGNRTIGEDSDGGGIFAADLVTITRSDLTNNMTQGRYAAGGALALDAATVDITDTSITGNQTDGQFSYGAGVFAVRSGLTITGSTLSGNSATGANTDGGGISSFFTSVTLNSTTVTQNNTTGAGGGLFFTDNEDRTLTIRNSIVAGNSDSGVAPDFRAPSDPLSLTVEFSLIGDNSGTTLLEAQSADAQGNFVGDPTGTGTIDPLLAPLTHTGQSRVHPLLAGSLAVNSGSNLLAIAQPNDQRGAPFVRIANFVTDMGAFERQTIAPSLLTVNTTTDELDFTNNEVSLREALKVADGNLGADVIRFDPTVFSTPSTINLTLGELTAVDSVSIDGPGSGQLTINAGGNSRVMTVAEGNAGLTLSGLTLTGGMTTARDDSGAAVRFLSTGTLVIEDSTLSNHLTGGDQASGGAVFSREGAIVIDQTTIRDNTTLGRDAHGGGIFGGGGVTATRSTIADNSTQGDGALGGGVYAERQSLVALSLTQSTVSGNSTSGVDAHGGGIAVRGGGLSVTNSTVSQNTSSGDGGGIHAGEGTHRVVSATVAQNTSAARGGGVSVGTGSNDTLFVHNSIVATNADSGPAPDLDASRLAGDLMVDSSLIGDNTGTSLDEAQTADSLGNLIGAPDPGAGVIDPLLGPLQLQGGTTATHSLLSSSPAINAGDPLLLGALTTDQRGAPFVRVSESLPDMGAFERQTLTGSLLIVTTADDELDFSNNDTSLREALVLAAGSAGPDTIQFDATVFAQPTTIDLTLGEMIIGDSVNISGPGRDLLTVDANDDSRIFHVNAPSVDVLLEGITLTGGRTVGDNAASETTHSGGAIRFFGDGTLTVRDSAITGNRTEGFAARGGGIFVREGTLVLDSSLVTNNRTEGTTASGGGIRVADGRVVVTDSTISNNSTAGESASGAGIEIVASNETLGASVISGSTIADNVIGSTDAFGAGIGMSLGGDLSIVDSVIRGNRTNMMNANGAGVFFRDGSLSIRSSTIDANRTLGAESVGAGILVFNATLDLTDSAVTANSVEGNQSSGGGIYINQSTSRIVNSTVSGNIASGVDSLAAAVDLAGTVTVDVINSTLTNNTSGTTAGGIRVPSDVTGTLTIHNSIVAGNIDLGIAPDVLFESSVASFVLASSLIGDNAGTLLTEAQTADASGNLIGSSAGAGIIDPMLAALANNGGTTLTHAPLAASPVIDAGDDALAVDGNAVPLTNDGRGAPFARVSGVSVDLGAVEAQPPVEPIIVWQDPENIFVGTALSSVQLNATADTDGTFVYTPDAGTVLPLGENQTLMVEFTPADTVNYAPTTASVLIDVVAMADLGDAPDSYATLRSSDGPRHLLGTLTLGFNIDAEVDGQPTTNASGDGDDDDGVALLTSLVADSFNSTTASMSVRVSRGSKLDAWFDFDGNGTFDHPSEHIGGGTSIDLLAGSNVVPFTIPAGAVAGETFARFRVSSDGGLLPTGEAADGEVEDYVVQIRDGSDSPTVEVTLLPGSTTLRNDLGEFVVQGRTSELFRAPESSVGRYEVVGNALSNVLTIDSSGGVAIPPRGLSFDGVDRVNTVRVVGSGTSLDLTRDGNISLRKVDVIDLTDLGETVLSIDARAARAIDPSGDGTVVVGTADDRIVIVDGTDWRMADPEIVAGVPFSVVTVPNTSLQLDFTSPWQNLAQASDVNNDGMVTAGDALRIINELGRRAFSDPQTAVLNNAANVSPWPNLYYDQNGDGMATALDALRVINELARINNAGGAGEGEAVAVAFTTAPQNGATTPNTSSVETTLASEQLAVETDLSNGSDSGRGITASELSKNLQYTVEVSQSWSEPIDELVEHVLAFEEMVFAIGDLLG